MLQKLIISNSVLSGTHDMATKAIIMLFASTFIVNSCAYTGKSKTFTLLLEKGGVHDIQKGLEGIIKSNLQVMSELNQKKKKTWMRFAIVGDTISNQNIVFRALLDKISRLEPPPEFIVNLGDFTGGRPGHYSYYFDTIKYYPYPIIHIMGNHEIENEGEMISRTVFGETDFFFDYNDVRLIFMGSGNQGITSQRLDWLEDKLKADYPAKKIFFSHKFPLKPFSELFPKVYSFFLQRRKNEEAVLDLLDKYDVSVAVFGHSHRYYEKIHRGTVMIISGGGGQRAFLEPKAKEPLSTKEKHFTIVDVLAGREQGPQGVISCISRYGKPLFMTAFYLGESKGNGDGPSMQLTPFKGFDNKFVSPPYIGELYKAYLEKVPLE
jgi:predicted phosphodiesterase